MSRVDRLADVITGHSRLVIVTLLVLSVLVGAGASDVDQSSSLDQFQSDTSESQKLSYINDNFTTGSENTTSVQLILRGDNVLDKQSLVEQIALEQALAANETVNGTLSTESPATGIANVVASTAIAREQGRELRARGQELQQRRTELNRTAGRLTDSLNRTRELQARYDRLNASREQGEIDNETYRERSAELESQLATVRTEATADLNADQTETYSELFAQTRTLQQRLDALNASYGAGEIDQQTYRERSGRLQQQFGQVYRGVQGVLAPGYETLQEDAEALQADQRELQNSSASGEMPPLSEQREQLASMNESEIDDAVTSVLGERNDGNDGAGGFAFAFMPTDYEPGSTEADATMLVVTQTASGSTAQGTASDSLVASQNAIREIATEEFDEDALVFGAGIIADEINQSMEDSLSIVGPLALLFVLGVLAIAYRDIVDIALGFAGIGLVLTWTFGFMGWMGISFNQIMIAVPVLLIGLSIDYAIHVFMRHREERTNHTEAVHESMKLALASVGVALALVTATTVIGFLSNLTSSVPPIRDFGIVSAFGIVAALVVFGALVPALKVEIDGFLEGHGFNRKKRAFGTGGGALGRLLGVGTTAARIAPWLVIALALVVSGVGAYGATQVDTSFAQEDFLADEPADWMYDLPEPLAPSEYTAKSSLSYVNDNFLRQDSSAEILVEGTVTEPDTLERLQRAQDAAREKPSTVVLSNGEADITSPLSAVRSVARENESFNETFTNADTDGDGVPDRNVEAVYDSLYGVAPERATGVVHRTDEGDYEALRMTVSLKGGAEGDAVTTQMRDVAVPVDGNGLTATATGQPIVFKLVQDQLLDTVIESLVITLIAVFAFLMATYRITDGSATLGFITLLPVVLSVSWILGTMYLMDIPFNVLTGMITSLTVGLGVAYSIHVSERYAHELDRLGSVWDAMERTVTGTGGALLGSAATTVGGFGVLAFAILPPLRQFGIITGLTIVYAFLASVLVLPSLLVVWTRYLGPGPDSAPDGTAPRADVQGED